MKKMLTAAALFVALGSATHAAVPAAVVGALQDCCSVIASCCELAMACCG